MRRAFAVSLLLLSSVCVAQTTAFAPTLIHGNSLSLNNPVVMDQLVAGKLFVVWVTWATSHFGTVGITDSMGNSFTPTTLCHAHNVGGSGGDAYAQAWYAVVNSTGTDTISSTGLVGVSSFFTIGYGEFDNISGTLDAQACATTAVAAASQTTALSTTLNGDLLISFTSGDTASNNTYATPPNQLFGGNGGVFASAAYWRVAGLAGSQSTTFFNNQNDGNIPDAWTLETLSFQPSAITVTTNALADGANGSAYKSTLAAVGGAGPYTWSNTAGSWPTGCSSASINSAGVISCTPSSNGTFSLTFQVTDGTHTTTRILSWKVGAAFNTPTFVTSSAGYSSTNGGISISYATLPNACPGDTFIVTMSSFTGGAAHGGAEIPPTNGTSDFWTSSCPTTWQRINPITGTPGNAGNESGSALATFVGSVSAACTAVNVGYAINGNFPSPSGLIFSLAQWRGVQPTIDDGVGVDQAGFPSNPISLTTPNLTTQVANEILYGVGTNGNGQPASDIVTISSPFSTAISWFCLFSLECQVAATDTATSAGTYALTVNENTSGGNNQTNTLAGSLIGLRPALAPAACVFPLAGEKHRRQPW